MIHATSRFGGVTVATLAAGPLFILGAAISVLISDPAAVIPVDIEIDGNSIGMMLEVLPPAFLIAMIFGSIIAFLPNLFGNAAMTWLGDRNPGTQLPVFWALVGATAFAVPIAAMGGASHGHLVPFVFTGACCALICRRRVSWEKE
ncbi:MAG: hypothetical protein ABI240_10080 [Sphingomonas sp.]